MLEKMFFDEKNAHLVKVCFWGSHQGLVRNFHHNKNKAFDLK